MLNTLLGLGFADLFVQKTSSSRAKFQAVIELKYLPKSKVKPKTIEADIENLKSQGRAQLERYISDKRMGNLKNLKKFVIIFVRI